VKRGVEVQYAVPSRAGLPKPAQLRKWARRALRGQPGTVELAIRVVRPVESAALNLRYRHRPGPTNVLSFPLATPPGLPLRLLGDLVICAALVQVEAAQQSKPERHHWAHLVVHGVLHLLGYDHLGEADAATMEAREREILAGLGIPDPYREAAS
jgi:probable rRNA maturation factor